MIEIMIVIAIMMMVMMTGVPLATRALQKDPLAKAVNDTLEGCKLARDRAILQNRTYRFVIRNRSEEEAEMMVEPDGSKEPGATAAGLGAGGPAPESSGPAVKEVGSLVSDFPRKLGKDVAIQLIYVNLVDHMGASEASVRFFSNGTSDEFTVIYAYRGKQRTIKVDIITGSAWEAKE